MLVCHLRYRRRTIKDHRISRSSRLFARFTSKLFCSSSISFLFFGSARSRDGNCCVSLELRIRAMARKSCVYNLVFRKKEKKTKAKQKKCLFKNSPVTRISFRASVEYSSNIDFHYFSFHYSSEMVPIDTDYLEPTNEWLSELYIRRDRSLFSYFRFIAVTIERTYIEKNNYYETVDTRETARQVGFGF